MTATRELAEIIDRGADRYDAGDLEGAALLWREALALSPEDVRARAYLAWALARLADEVGGEAARDPAGEDSATQVLGPIARARGGRGSLGLALDDEPLQSDGEDLGVDAEPTRQRGAPGRPLLHEEPPVEDEPTHSYPIDLLSPLADGDPIALSDERRSPRPLELPTPRHLRLGEDDEHGQEKTPTGIGGPGPRAGEDFGADLMAELAAEQAAADDGGDELEMVIEMEVGEPGELQGPPPLSQGAPTPTRDEISRRWRIGPEDDPLVEARAALEAGEEERAFSVAEKVVAWVAGIDAPELTAHHELLLRIYERPLGDRTRVLAVAAMPHDLHPRAAFLLSRVDGTLTLDDLRDVSGMPHLEATRLLAVLLHRGALVAIAH
ncbi:MAG: hypothetical protein EXR72_27375 [Myxococcales bacterium]|nr:hypothetical protein [Myxococcales bacterium]